MKWTIKLLEDMRCRLLCESSSDLGIVRSSHAVQRWSIVFFREATSTFIFNRPISSHTTAIRLEWVVVALLRQRPFELSGGLCCYINGIETLASSGKRRAHKQRKPAAHNNQRFRAKMHDVLFSFQNFQAFQWYVSNVQTPQSFQSNDNTTVISKLC